MIKIALIFFLSFFTFYAQSNAHVNAWGRLSIAFKNPESSFKFESEFQKRTQNNGVQKNHINPFDENLLESFRLWIHYKKSNNNLNFSFSPVAYFEHTPIIRNIQDFGKNKLYEYRISTAVDYHKKIFDITSTFMRSALEFRDFQYSSSNSLFRFRNKIGLKFQCSTKFNFSFFDELFLNLNSQDKSHIFDHNRIGSLISYRINPHITFDFGYVAITRLARNDIETMFDNNYLLMLYYTFSPKKK